MGALSNSRHERFYVYAVRIGGRTRYVGKGTGHRSSVHLTRSHNPAVASEVAAARAIGTPVRVRILKGRLTEREALRLERRVIAKWGHRLLNVALGNGTALDNVAAACRADLKMIKSEEAVRRECGSDLENRLRLRAEIVARLARIEARAMAA